MEKEEKRADQENDTEEQSTEAKSLLKKKLQYYSSEIQRDVGNLVKWLMIAVLVGCITGAASTLFSFVLKSVTNCRKENEWMFYLLPVMGLIIVYLYEKFGKDDGGTNQVLSTVRSQDDVPILSAPLIFISTALTHLAGGSAGREGAAIQLGGSIANQLGRWIHLDEEDRHVIVMCGMSAAFSALFGTPMAAAVFSMEVVSVGVMYYAALVPCVISSLVAHAVAEFFGVSQEMFLIGQIPAFKITSAVKISVLAILCAGVSIIFCVMLHQSEHLYKKFFKNPYVRIFAGVCFVLILTLLVGNQNYNGTGINIIEQCIDGTVRPEAFFMKMLFTALTLGAGFKGGEIVPSFFTGAAFGCLFGNLSGFSPTLCTAVGMAAVFCGVTNCPITALLISFELFGYDGMPYFLLAVAFSYMLSGYYGLYSSQKIIYSKYKTNYINRKTH